jgi:predicted TIM-barrel fold metal-dependent hydrolase
MTAADRKPAASGETTVRLVDCDVHQDLVDWNELQPYLDPAWWDRIAPAGPPFGARSYSNVRGHILSEDMINPATGKPADDPGWVERLLFDTHGVDVGILTSDILSLSSLPNMYLASALARAYNDWTLEKWVRPHQRFKGSIIVAPQDPEAAVAEIERLGDDPGVVQVLIFSGAEMPYGKKRYHPIWEAAARHGLPVAMHSGGEQVGIAPAGTLAGSVSYYFEHHALHPQSAQTHLVSLVSEGVFEKYPNLKFLFVEHGFSWLPHIMWRLDKDFKGNRSEAPWLKRLPSEYILENCRFSTQPIDEPSKPEHLLQIFDMVEADRTILFASDFPHWDFDDPKRAFRHVPAILRERIFVGNAVDLYGERLLAPSRNDCQPRT